jgi:hypothetical protein
LIAIDNRRDFARAQLLNHHRRRDGFFATEAPVLDPAEFERLRLGGQRGGQRDR